MQGNTESRRNQNYCISRLLHRLMGMTRTAIRNGSLPAIPHRRVSGLSRQLGTAKAHGSISPSRHMSKSTQPLAEAWAQEPPMRRPAGWSNNGDYRVPAWLQRIES